MIELTQLETALFIELVQDAPDWNGSPLWNQCNDKTLSDNAVLGSLVKKGLVTTCEDETYHMVVSGKRLIKKKVVIQFVSFTDSAIELVKTMPELAKYSDRMKAE